MNKQNEELDDINLSDLWKAIAKRKMLIIGLFIIVVGLTAISSFMAPNLYRGEALLFVNVNTDIIDAKEIVDSVGIINSEKREKLVPKSYPSVTNIKLKVNKFKRINNKIEVTIDAKTIDVIPKALSEVLNYLNNIDIIKSTTSEEKAKLLIKAQTLSDMIKFAPDRKSVV